MDELLDNAPCGFLTFADDGRIVEANATLARMLGYDAPEELRGAEIAKILSVAGRIFYQTHFFPLLKLKNHVEEVYLSLRGRSGADIPVLVNAARHERDGAYFNDCVLMAMRNRNQYEDEILRAKKQAEEALRAKDEFLSVVSHELRTPLTGILGWSQMLRQKRLSPDKAERAVESIARGARAQSRLIEDILDFTRVISGKLRLEVSQVDLALVVESAVEVVMPAAEAKDIRLRTVLDSEAFVSGDANRLQQVVWNLLANAVKFTPRGGRVQINVERVGASAEIVVSDTGEGISAEFLPFVFERFKQSDNSTTRRHGGLGLGMAITRHIVELHGGTIRAESPGEALGSTFTVTLPIASVNRRPPVSDQTRGERFDEADEPETDAETLPRLDNLRVLVVDDEADARELLETVLSEQGAEVFAASSVAAALERIQTEPPDLVVSDLEMPGEDGFSLVRKLRDLDRGRARRIPAIALTAHVRPADRVKVLSSGFQAHLAKPVDTSELVAVVASLAELHK